MKRQLLQVFTAALMVVLLAACSMMEGDPTRLMVSLTPAGALTATTEGLEFRNPPGQGLVEVVGMTSSYYDGDGVLLEQWLARTDVSVVVPAGFSCAAPDETLGCDAFDEGARANYGQTGALTSSNLLPASVQAAHERAVAAASEGRAGEPSPNFWAEFTFIVRSQGSEYEIRRVFDIR